MRALLFVTAFVAGIAQAKPYNLPALKGAVTSKHLRIADKIAELPKDSVAILEIDSPGGSAEVTRRILIELLQAQTRGVVFECVVVGSAMSAALVIHSYCDKRYALPLTTFLWHSIRGGGPAKEGAIRNRKELFEDYNRLLWGKFKPFFKDKVVYTRYYENDGVMFAGRLLNHAPGYMKIIRTPYER